MAYEPTNWQAGDTVTSAKLNKMEQGISDNGVLEINATVNIAAGEVRLDKTWQEIYNANNSIIIIPSDFEFSKRANITTIGESEEGYFVNCYNNIVLCRFFAETPDDYPVMNMNTGGNTQPVA